MKLCISTVVDSTYQAWAPIFIYCLQTQYPEYDVMIFTRSAFNDRVKSGIDLCPLNNKSIIEGYFDRWHKHLYSPISWRFCIDKEEYQGYDYVYITDIDMMILREKVELMSFHLNEMAQTGLCYSNSLRNIKHWKGQESVSGLHFASSEFFEKTQGRMLYYAKKVKSGEVGMKREYDGNMLYRIIKESGLGMCDKYPLAPRHHGIHMGSCHLYSGDRLRKKLKKRVDKDKCRKWLKMLEDEKFREIIKLCSYDEKVKRQTEQLEEFCKIRTKI